MRQEGVIEGTLPVKHQDNDKYKNKKTFKNQPTNGDSSANYQKTKGGSKKSYSPCRHCEKKGHPHTSVGEDLRLPAPNATSLDMKL